MKYKLIILVLSILLLSGCTIRLGYDYYEYEDLDGNKGTANDCMTIRGNLLCDLKDGTRVSVKSFKGIYKD